MLNYLTRNAHYLHPGEWPAALRAITRRLTKSGMLTHAAELPCASLNPTLVPQLIVERFRPRSVLDIGCGTGKTLDFFLSRGVDAWGVEGSRSAIRRARNRGRIVRHDLRQPMYIGRYDLVWCFEVAEHIHPRFADTFVDTLARHAPIIVMSAAPPGQGGEGHFNEQPASYWIAKFGARGYTVDTATTALVHKTREFYSENIVVYHTTQGNADSQRGSDRPGWLSVRG